MLVKIKKTGILYKALNFLKNIFFKQDKYNKRKEYEIKQDNNLISKIKEKRKIIDLQNKYERCIIKEESLTEEEKEKLIALYQEQISELEEDINEKLENLELYKQKIIVARKNIIKN